MGYYVHLHVCFACDTNEGVAELARKHADSVGDCLEAKWFLASLSERTGHNPGPKGGLSMWGIVGNYAEGEVFCDALRSFWAELLTGGVSGGPCSFEHVLVFEEAEQKECAIAYEISRDEETGNLEIKRHECPFAWMQM